jgi:TonB family protein
MQAIDTIAAIGASSIEWFWLPVAAWSALWLIAEVILRLSPDGHPMIRYRVNQALLVSLPVALVTAALIDLSFLLPAAEPIYVESVAASFSSGTVLPMPEHVVSTPSFPIGHVAAGLGLLAAGVASLVALGQLGTHVVNLRRFRLELEATSTAVPLAAALSDDPSSIRHRKVLVLETGLETVPMTFGLVRPTIVIPDSLGEADRRIALFHEMMHIRHFDYAARIVELMVRALFAFHPAVTALARRCELWREMTCDAAMLNHSVDRTSYANLLFRFAVPPASPLPLSVSMADTRPQITHRIKAMTTTTMHSGLRTHVLAALLTIAVLTVFSFGSAATLAIAQGAPQEVIIRSSDRSPIVEIDGVIAPDGVGALDPSSIKSIDVIRGDRAVEEFGERGRDGVIRIQTHISGTTHTSPEAGDFDTFVLRYPEMAQRAGIKGRVTVRSADHSHLVEIDGVIVDRGLDSVDPSTIATIDVLRGDRAVEEYGERGRDGVIRIRTHAADTSRTSRDGAPSGDADTFVIVEQMPELIGGLASIQQTLRYPELAKRAGIEGRVFVQFIVDEQGNVVDPEVVRGVGSGLDAAALDAVRGARFKPGVQRGQAVRVRMSLPITFRLNGDSPRDETRRLRTTLSTVDVSDSNVSVAGRVVDSVTGDPVTGANVVFTMHGREFGASTDPDGHFRVRLERVAGEPANPSMTVSHANYPENPSQSLNTVDSRPEDVPVGFAIHGAYPNPFNPAVTLTFSLPKSAAVSVSVFDVTGREVMTLPARTFDAGERHDIAIDGSSLPSGMYLYRLTASIDGQPHTLSGTVTLLK